MKLTLLVVGKLRSRELRSLCDDYKSRIARYATLNEIEVKDDGALLRALPKAAHVVAMDVAGRPSSSTQFSEQVITWGSTGNGHVCFVIGGAEGIPPQLTSTADVRLSLSAMTLPHRLARLLLLEQIYRALSIWRGEPYARED